MKIPSLIRKHYPVIALVVVMLMFFVVGITLASSGEEHGTKGWIATDTFRVMNFAVLAIALFFLLRKPVAQALSDRIKGIQNQLIELEEKKKEAEKKLAEYNERLSHLDQEADKIIQAYIKQGEEAKVRILEQAKIAAEKLEDQARRSIEHEFKQAKLELQEDILEKALVKAEAMINTKITTEDQDKLVDEYLEKVVAS